MLDIGKQIIKQIVSPLADRAGVYDHKVESLLGSTNRLLVLMYHRVIDDLASDPFALGMCVRQKYFEEQLAWLAANTQVLPLNVAVQRLLDNEPLPPHAVAITFDDGLLDNLTCAAPLLEKYRLPATFYIITGGLEEGTPMWWDQAIAMLATTNAQSLDPRAVGLPELPHELSLHRHARRASCITILNALWERNPTAIAQCLEQMRKVLRPGTIPPAPHECPAGPGDGPARLSDRCTHQPPHRPEALQPRTAACRPAGLAPPAAGHLPAARRQLRLSRRPVFGLDAGSSRYTRLSPRGRHPAWHQPGAGCPLCHRTGRHARHPDRRLQAGDPQPDHHRRDALKKQTQYLNILLAAMIVWVPNQLHLPADLGVKGLNSINLLFLALIYYVHQRNKKLPPSEATPLKGVFIAYFCMLVWAFLAGQLSDRSLMMEDLTAMKNSIFFMCLYFVFFHGARDETSVRHLFYVVLFVAAVAGIEAVREGIDYGFGVYGETKRAAGPFGSNYKASNLAAVFFSMFMPVFAAVALYQKGRPTVRMGAIAGVVILLLGIFCTYSRQAYLIVAAMLLLMTLKRNVVLGILILVAVVNYQAWVPEGVVTRLAMTEQTSEETGEEQLDESTESRFILWAGAGRLLMSRPWGIGLNHFKREIGSEEPSLAGLDAHNFLVLITTEAGPFGGIMTLILYASLGTLAWRFWKLARTPDQQAMAAGFAGATIAVMLGNLYGSRLLDGAVTGNYWILAGLSARYWLLLKNGTRDETGALIDTTQATTTSDGKGPDDKPRPPIQGPATRPDRPSPRDADGRLIRPAG